MQDLLARGGQKLTVAKAYKKLDHKDDEGNETSNTSHLCNIELDKSIISGVGYSLGYLIEVGDWLKESVA